MSRYELDGHLVPCTKELIAVTDEHTSRGMILRTVNREWVEVRGDDAVVGGWVDTSSAFSDAVIVDVFFRNSRGVRINRGEEGVPTSETYVLLARPYAYISSADTTCPGVLMGYEKYEVSRERLCEPGSHYRVVVQSTGLPARYTT